MNTLPAEQTNLRDFVDEFDARVNGGKIERENPDGIVEIVAEFPGIESELEAFAAATEKLKGYCRLGTRYIGSIFTDEPRINAKHVKDHLLKAAWWHIYDRLQIDRIAPAGDRSKIEQMIEGHCPDFTLENLGDQFGKYQDVRSHLLRGLAEQFVKLDPVFKSHDKMKVGVKGLPTRIILKGCSEDYAYRNNGAERLMDIINAVRAFEGKPLMNRAGIGDFMKSAKYDDGLIEGFKLRRHMNGNAHLYLDDPTRQMVNLALAEFYGEVLPDCPEAQNSQKSNASTAVSKDLQFFRTPAAAADFLLAHAEPYRRNDQRHIPLKVLEPSCGDGAILDAMSRYARNPDHRQVKFDVMGVEVHPDRAAAAKAKGHKVLQANFLSLEPNPIYDLVLMNPPFYGKHYQQHVEHALKFLKPDGLCYAILPVTAVTDHGYVEADRWGYEKWRDLPVGSFSESGTNINTGIARFFAPEGW